MITITGRYACVEGDYYYPTLTTPTHENRLIDAAVRFINDPIFAAEIAADEEITKMFPRDYDDDDIAAFFVEDENSDKRSEYIQSKIQEAKTEALQRGSIVFEENKSGLTRDCASYDSGVLHVSIKDEQGFSDYCAERGINGWYV